jgi:Mg-chelatase subunit ChlD
MKSIRRPTHALRSGKENDSSSSPSKPRGPIWLQASRLLRAGLVLLGLVLLLFAVPSRGSRKNGPLTVVLAVDTSGSMKKTDPRNLRREASKLLLSLLGPEDRLALVTFDTRATVRCPLENAAKSEAFLASQIDRIRSDGKFTDLHDAVRVSHEAFGPSGRSGPRAIVFLTDGKMDTGDPDRDLRLTEALLDERVPRLSEERIPVYAIAFSPLADAALLDRIAKATGGFFYMAESAEDLHVVLLRIYRQLARPDALPVQGKTFLVDPSVREMTIVVTKTEASQGSVAIRTPGGRRLTSQEVAPGIRWFAAEAFDMITVERPEAGTWEIDYRQEAPKEVFILTDLGLLSSFEENALAPGAVQPIEIWLEEKGERLPAGILLTQGVDFRCELESEGGNKTEVPLRDDGLSGDRTAGDGIFTGTLQPDKAGTYRLSFWALGKTFERRRVHEFRVIDFGPAFRPPEANTARIQPRPDEAGPEGPSDAAIYEAAEREPQGNRKPVNWKLEIAQFFLVNAGLAAAAAAYWLARGRKRRKLLPGGSRP